MPDYGVITEPRPKIVVLTGLLEIVTDCYNFGFAELGLKRPTRALRAAWGVCPFRA